MGTLIDTSWLIELEREVRNDPIRLPRLPDDTVISAVTIAELRMGVELADDVHRAQRTAFVDMLVSHAVSHPFGVEEALAYGSAAAALKRSGLRIGERDLLIAATALAGNHAVLTLNRSEFERVPALTLADVPTG